jgi:glycosyltransferase involved in cell wall biosynthesis
MAKSPNGTRPKVALFATNFGAYSQTFIYDEVTRHRGYDVEVFARNRENPDIFECEGVHALGPWRSRREWAEWLLYGATTISPRFMRRIRSGEFDILHAHFGPGSIYALPYQAAADLPLVVTYHGYDVPLLSTPRRFQPKYWRYWGMSKVMLRKVNRFLAASNELHDQLIELGAPKERVHVWRLGVHIPKLEEPPPGRDGTQILLVGRFVEKKGFEYAIEAFARVVGSGVDAHLNIVGDGELRPAYDAIIEREDIGDRVHFLGVMQHEDVLETMMGMDLLMCPSVVAQNGDRESGILVAKEAGARYLPVIGTYHGGIPEIIDDQTTGFLVPERNVDAIADRLGQLMRDPDLRETMGRAARKKMEREYDIDQRILVLEEHYDQVIEAYRRR